MSKFERTFHMYYDVKKGKRTNVSLKAKQHHTFNIELQANFPSFLSRDYFVRHGITRTDAELLVAYIPRKMLRYLLVFEKGSDQILNNTRDGLQKEVMQTLASWGLSPGPDRLVHRFDTHKPKLPVHCIPLSTWKKLMIEKEQDQDNLSLWSWKGITVFISPVLYHGYLKVVRVIPKQEDDERFGTELPRGQWACQYLFQGKVWCETEEKFLFQTIEGHNWLQQRKEPWLDTSPPPM